MHLAVLNHSCTHTLYVQICVCTDTSISLVCITKILFFPITYMKFHFEVQHGLIDFGALLLITLKYCVALYCFYKEHYFCMFVYVILCTEYAEYRVEMFS